MPIPLNEWLFLDWLNIILKLITGFRWKRISHTRHGSLWIRQNQQSKLNGTAPTKNHQSPYMIMWEKLQRWNISQSIMLVFTELRLFAGLFCKVFIRIFVKNGCYEEKRREIVHKGKINWLWLNTRHITGQKIRQKREYDALQMGKKCKFYPYRIQMLQSEKPNGPVSTERLANMGAHISQCLNWSCFR